MPQLRIDIKNCYGIGELKDNIDFADGRNCCVIYAPNGTMKTSFTKTFNDILSNNSPKDVIFNDRVSSCIIDIDGKTISKENCYVYNGHKEDGNASISTFLANKALKDKYDEVLKRLSDSWRVLKNKLASDSRSSNCGDEILKAFSPDGKQSIFECLADIYKNRLKDNSSNYTLYHFKYNDVFDKNDKVKKFVEDNLTVISEYFEKYQYVIRDSQLFSNGKDSFGTYQAELLLKSVDDDRFFKASHNMVLKNGQQITDKKQLEEIFNDEIERVLNDEDLKKTFSKIEKKLNNNAELRNFKETIQHDPSMVASLVDFESFRKNVLLGYLSHNINDLSTLVEQYEKEKKEIQNIIKEANESIDKWNEVIGLFNNRFFVPFEIYLKNQSDMILKEETATLAFRYKESETHKKEEEQSVLLSTLSTGEAKAFYILQNLFEIEARKASGKSTLLILDDVADSFDYKNKYAIIEYLADLKDDDKFTLIILTHNFDFYRTVVSRLQVKVIFFANRDADRKISLCTGIYNPDIIKRKFIGNITSVRSFIGLLPFARNLIEYNDGESSNDYKLLTSCLHAKDDTPNIKMSTIFDVYKRHLCDVANKNITFENETYMNVLFQEANAVLSDTNEVELANKLVLSIAIRIKSEQLMQKIISPDKLSEMKSNNQTGELVRILKKYYDKNYHGICLLMDKVVMLTSENIHFNNFMFEPLVDISSLHLKQLYREVLQNVI